MHHFECLLLVCVELRVKPGWVGLRQTLMELLRYMTVHSGCTCGNCCVPQTHIHHLALLLILFYPYLSRIQLQGKNNGGCVFQTSAAFHVSDD